MARGNKRGFEGPAPLTSSEITITRGLQKMRSRHPAYYRILRWVGRLAIVSVVVMALILVIAMVQNVNLRDELRSQLEDTYNPSYKVRHADLGATILDSWFSGGTPVVSTATGVTWPTSPYSQYPSPGNVPASVANPQDDQLDTPQPSDGGGEEVAPYSTTIRGIAFVQGGEELISEDPMTVGDATYQQPTREELTYRVALNNQVVNVTVVLLIQGGPPTADSPAPVMLAAPAISGSPEPEESVDASTAPSGVKVNTGNIPSGAVSLTESWIAAYAENDTDTLKQLARDPDTAREYVGLGGWAVEDSSGDSGNVTANWWYVVPGSDDGEEGSADIVAEISFPMYQIVPVGNSEEGISNPDIQNPEGFVPFQTVQTMTVLISDAESGSPSISSWGPPGTGEALEPYSAATSAVQEDE